MKIIKGLNGHLQGGKALYVALGAFDGIHPGHVRLIERAVTRARETGGESAVLTFEPHPRSFIRREEEFRLISTPEQKASLISSLGVDAMIVIEFDDLYAAMSPEEFCRDILAGRLGAAEVFVGFNFCFGSGRAGNAASLAEYGRKFGFAVNVLQSIEVSGFVVSSSKIRLLIETGAMEEVEKFLGRPYSLAGKVVRGDGLGRKLSVPTANILIDRQELIIPKNGVYAVECVLADGRRGIGAVNIGTRPTVYEKASTLRTVELHIIDFTGGDLYDGIIELRFRKRLRDERKFTDFGALCAQIAADIADTRSFFEGRE